MSIRINAMLADMNGTIHGSGLVESCMKFVLYKLIMQLSCHVEAGIFCDAYCQKKWNQHKK